jgi:hypothetical protein
MTSKQQKKRALKFVNYRRNYVSKTNLQKTKRQRDATNYSESTKLSGIDSTYNGRDGTRVCEVVEGKTR